MTCEELSHRHEGSRDDHERAEHYLWSVQAGQSPNTNYAPEACDVV